MNKLKDLHIGYGVAITAIIAFIIINWVACSLAAMLIFGPGAAANIAGSLVCATLTFAFYRLLGIWGKPGRKNIDTKDFLFRASQWLLLRRDSKVSQNKAEHPFFSADEAVLALRSLKAPWWILMSLCMLAAHFFLWQVVAQIYYELFGSPAIDRVNASFAEQNLLLLLISVIIVAPLAEEIVFRGVIFSLLRSSLSVWPSALISGFLFGLMHMNTPQFIVAAPLGVLCAFAYERTKMIGVPIAIHTLSNIGSLFFPADIGKELAYEPVFFCLAALGIVWIIMTARLLLWLDNDAKSSVEDHFADMPIIGELAEEPEAIVFDSAAESKNKPDEVVHQSTTD